MGRLERAIFRPPLFPGKFSLLIIAAMVSVPGFVLGTWAIVISLRLGPLPLAFLVGALAALTTLLSEVLPSQRQKVTRYLRILSMLLGVIFVILLLV